MIRVAFAVGSVSTVTTADDGWYRAVVRFARDTGWLQAAMSLYTEAALGLLVVLAAAAWWSARAGGGRVAMAAVVWVGLGTAVAVGCGLGLKRVFGETRPCLAMHVVTVQSCPGPADYSFPSDHTIVAVALATGVWLVSRRLGIVAAVVAVVEGFSRVYLGQHYPHDVAAGAVVAVVVMLVGWGPAAGPLTALVARLEATPLHVVTRAPTR